MAQPIGESALQKIVRLLAILGTILDASKSGAVPAIDSALDELCLLFKVRRTFVYLTAEDGTCRLAYRSSQTVPALIDGFPNTLPSKLIADWQSGEVGRMPTQVTGADFLERPDAQDPDLQDRQSRRILLFPMMRGDKVVGAIGYDGVSKAQADSEASLQMLRELTDVLQVSLAQDGPPATAAEQPTPAATGMPDDVGAVQNYGSIETVVAKLKDQETAMTALASAAEAAHTRLLNAIHALPDGMVIFDREDRLVAVNAAYLETFPDVAEHAVVGVKLRDLLRIGLEKQTFLGESTAEEREAWLQKRLMQYHLPHWDDEVQLPDGRWMHRISNRTSDGGVIATGSDITAKRNQIAALDAANKNLTQVLADRDRAEIRLSSIIDGAAVGTWELDVASNEIHIGGRWGEILGLETDKMSGLTVPDFVAMLHPDDRSKLVLAREFDQNQPQQIVSTEFRMRHRDGHWVWILSRCRVSERAADGATLRIAGVHLDISERKQLEQDVFSSRAFLLDVMDASNSAIVVLDGSHKVSYVNQEAERILGLIHEIEPGQNLDLSTLMLQRVDGEPLAEEDSPFNLALRASEPVRNIQCAFLRPDGDRGILSFNAALLDMGDQQFGVVSFADVTENLAATQRLQEALMRAEEMSRAKSTFLANMSHEIRTPLNGVLGMAEVLGDSVTEPLQRQMVDTIRKSGETLLTVLNGILDMSKIEAGKMVVEQVAFVPLDLIRQAESIYAVTAEEKGVEFEVLATAGCDKPRLGDAHRLMQMLNNLLNNAFKFTESGNVTLKVSCRIGKPVQIDVSDTGIGMDASQVSRVFESFEQADGSMTRRFGGTGLGLSIVRRTCDADGRHDNRRKHAETRLDVPYHLAAARGGDCCLQRSSMRQKTALREDGLAGVRLLCADDNATNRLVLSEMLAKTGAVVTQVENGREAVESWAGGAGRGMSRLNCCCWISPCRCWTG